MATWMVHFRIADYFLENIDGLEPTAFAAGNVAPDCGYGKKDSKGKFDPPPTVTHWSPSGGKRDCRYKDFYNEYLKDRINEEDYSFYLGYYIHLLTDIMWSSQMYMGTIKRFPEESQKSKDFLKLIKRDWNDLDFKYFRDNPKLKTYRLLDREKKFKDYLPYYEKGQLTKQLKFITEYYKDKSFYRSIDREYYYLTPCEVDAFIALAEEIITDDLKKKALI